MHNTYIHHKRKKEIREFLLNKFEFNSVIGLAGPDINEYIEYMEGKGCKEFQLYENNPSTLIRQLSELRRSGDITLKYKDILLAPYPYKKNVLYDLDFCVSIEYMKEYTKKFKSKFIMTFSLRPFGAIKTIRKFFKNRGETILERVQYSLPVKHTIIKTQEGEYIYISYRDTVPMCCIAKIN